MNRSLKVLCGTILMLSLFGCQDKITTSTEPMAIAEVPKAEKSKPNFVIEVGPRFNPIKKKDIKNFSSYPDIIGHEYAENIVTFKSVSVSIQDEEANETKITSYELNLSSAQLALLKSLDYSENIYIRAAYSETDENGYEKDITWTPYYTVVPEKQASYKKGHKALLDYLRVNSTDTRTDLDANKLQSAAVYFTVSKDGSVKDISIDNTSGYPLIDEKMIDLISDTDGEWVPAETEAGEKIDQRLCISYGRMGC